MSSLATLVAAALEPSDLGVLMADMAQDDEAANTTRSVEDEAAGMEVVAQDAEEFGDTGPETMQRTGCKWQRLGNQRGTIPHVRSLVALMTIATLMYTMDLKHQIMDNPFVSTERARLVYGTCDRSVPPVADASRDVVRLADVPWNSTMDSYCCPTVAGQVLREMTKNNSPKQPDNVTWLYRPPPYRPFASHARVPALHCRFDYETNGSWWYVARGSAVTLDIGRTIAFQSHLTATLWFMTGLWPTHAMHGLLATSAAARGYDSIQFVGHADMRCGHTAHEILMTRHAGNATCTGPLLDSVSGRDCECDPDAACASCGGRVVLPM